MSQEFSPAKYPAIPLFSLAMCGDAERRPACEGIDTDSCRRLKQVPAAEYNPMSASKPHFRGRKRHQCGPDCGVKGSSGLEHRQGGRAHHPHGATCLTSRLWQLIT
jgi:hypothetical protein